MTTRSVVDYNNLAGNKRPCTIAGLAGLGDDLETLNLLRVNSDGEILISGTLNQGPVQFDLNGTDVDVAFDESTAANNRPLPTFLVNGISGAAYQGATSANQVIEIALLHNLTGSAGGGATSANQVIEIAELSAATASLASIDTKTVQGALNYGVATGAIRTAAQIGNAAGVADFNAGAAGAQTLRVVQASDSPLPTGSATSANQVIEIATLQSITGSQAVIVAELSAATGSLSSIDTKLVQQALNYGAATGAVRVAAQIGNASAVADFNAGTAGAQTLRVSANITRNGTELSYGSGTIDANTQRVVLPTDQATINVMPQNVIVTTAYGYVSAGYTSTTDTYIYKATAGGGTLQTVTITYADSTKQNISTIERS